MRLHFDKLSDSLMLPMLLCMSLIIVSCSDSGDDPNPMNDPGNGMDQVDDQVSNETGKAAPAFELESLDGGTVKLSDFNDKVVVIFFLGSSCSLCRAVAPSVESELHSKFNGNSEYAILGLDTWDGNNSAVKTFKESTGVTFPLLLKASGVASEYGTTYDRLVVIDKEGKIAHSGTRAATNDIATVKAKVEELLDSM